MTNPFADPSLRRFVAMLAGAIAAVGNKRLGLDIEPAGLTELLVFLGGYIVAANTKEAVVARATAAATAAAAAVVPGAAADAIVDAAAKGTP